MLNVPEEIKELFHQDTCYKNIRIHFPNGERSDICNDLIVKDSVSFKESLCSQRTLKFGLCEAPVFECETVGVGNIKKALIEVSCEIECDPTIEDAVWKVDLQKYVYSVPYGTFVVDSCKRQSDMQHRKIIAYGGLAYKDWDVCEFEKHKPSRSTTYKPLLAFFLASNDFDILSDYVDEVVQPWTASGSSYPATYEITRGYWPPGTEYYVSIEIKEGYYILWSKYDGFSNVDKNKIFRVDADFLYDKDMEKEINDLLSPYPLLKDEIFLVHDCLKNGFFQMVDKVDSQINIATKLPNVSRKNIYPYAENFYRSGSREGQAIYRIPKRVRVNIWHQFGQWYVIDYKDFTIINGTPVLYQRTFKQEYSYLESLVITVPSPSRMPSYPSITWYSPEYKDISVQTLANAYAELLGCFAFIKGDKVELLNIKRQFGLTPGDTLYPGTNVYPEGVTGGKLLTEDYQTCWYDDDYTKPYGLVECEYKKSNNETILYRLFLDGFDENTDPDSYQTYSLSNNEIIKNNVWTDAQIESICETIANNISGVTYMPVDFKGRGLPYVEAGDTFEILTKSNDSITTIVLNRTITGEQTLVDTYQSV